MNARHNSVRRVRYEDRHTVRCSDANHDAGFRRYNGIAFANPLAFSAAGVQNARGVDLLRGRKVRGRNGIPQAEPVEKPVEAEIRSGDHRLEIHSTA
jgi:hypothetical protein